MSTPTISPKVCGGLLSKTLPEVIETDRELGHFADALETLDRLDRELKPEEKLLEALLSRLIADYDKKVELPQLPPHKTIAFLMEQRGLKQADLLPGRWGETNSSVLPLPGWISYTEKGAT